LSIQALVQRFGMGNGRAILVTGAAGLIGRRVAEMLIADGRAVLATDRIALGDGTVPIEPADLTDAAALDALVRRAAAGIIHCGAISGPMLGRDDPASTIAINVLGTVNLLECTRRLGGGRFVFCGSVSAYGATPAELSPVPVTAPLAAVGIYGASKAAADILVRAYASEHGIDAAALRIGWVYGPRRRTRSLLHRLIRDALDGRPSLIEHDGRYQVQMIHVDDVARGLIAAFDQPRMGVCAFNLTAGTRIAMSELGDAVRRQLPAAQIEFMPGVTHPDVEQALFDIGPTCSALAWSPRVTLDEGVAGYIDWLRTHPS
jgi:UDP-glucuronate 4-epimerase